MCAAAIVGLVGTSCATTPAYAQRGYASQVELTFSRLELDERLGRLVVDYRLDRRDWSWARTRSMDLWLTVSAPDRRGDPILYSMPLESDHGEVVFPDNVGYTNDQTLGLCVVAVGVDDAFDPGWGYVCDDPVVVATADRHGFDWGRRSIRLSLGFVHGLGAYPWFGAAYGFHYPPHFFRPRPYARGYHHPRVHRGRRHGHRYRHRRRHGHRYRHHGHGHRRHGHRSDGHRRRHHRRRHRPSPGADRSKPHHRPSHSVQPNSVPKRRVQPHPTRPSARPNRPAPKHIKPKRIKPKRIKPKRIKPKRINPRHIKPKRPAPKHIKPKRITPKRITPNRTIRPKRHIQPQSTPRRAPDRRKHHRPDTSKKPHRSGQRPASRRHHKRQPRKDIRRSGHRAPKPHGHTRD